MLKITLVKGVLDADWTEDGIVNSKHPPGSIEWLTDASGQVTTLGFVCPCGCQSVVTIPVFGHRAWNWNQDKEKPTLTPSILRRSGCRWHGWLTNGEFRTC